jgi:hypothetical protein
VAVQNGRHVSYIYIGFDSPFGYVSSAACRSSLIVCFSVLIVRVLSSATSYLSASRQHIHILKLYRRARSRATILTYSRLSSISGGRLRMVRNASIQRRTRRLENETPDCGFAPRARKTGTYTACQSQER